MAISILSACSKEEDDNTKQNDGIIEKVITCTKYNEWVYYSFKTGKTFTLSVSSNKYKTRKDWDIAFHRYNFRLNGGQSGDGNVAAKLLGEGEIKSFTEIPKDGYIQDETISIMEKGAMPPTYVDTPGSKVLNGYYDGEGKDAVYHAGAWKIEKGQPPIYHPSNRVYAIKTMDGKYAVIKFADYYDSWGVPANVKLQYIIK